jgi:hypothetical protein
MSTTLIRRRALRWQDSERHPLVSWCDTETVLFTVVSAGRKAGYTARAIHKLAPQRSHVCHGILSVRASEHWLECLDLGDGAAPLPRSSDAVDQILASLQRARAEAAP